MAILAKATASAPVYLEGSNAELSQDLSGNLRIIGSITVDSEFPAAAVITDNFANPTTTSVMAMNMGWDGSNWDRIKSDANQAMNVNPGAIKYTTDDIGTIDLLGLASTYYPDMDTSAAAEASSVTKASAGVCYGYSFSNGTGSTVYFQLFNSTTVPADTAVPVYVKACPANSTIEGEWPRGRYFATGIAWCGSTTQNNKTVGGSSFLADVHFK